MQLTSTTQLYFGNRSSKPQFATVLTLRDNIQQCSKPVMTRNLHLFFGLLFQSLQFDLHENDLSPLATCEYFHLLGMLIYYILYAKLITKLHYLTP